MFLVVLGAAASGTAQSITEFPIPNPAGGGGGIAIGPDGNVWFTEFLSNKIGRLTRDGVVTEFQLPTSNAYPLKIAAAVDGLWFTEWNASKIGRIGLDGVITEIDLPTAGATPYGLVVAGDGSVWIAEIVGNSIAHLQVDGTIEEFPVPTQFAQPLDLAIGIDGSIWFTELDGNNLGRLSVGGTMTEFPIPTAGSAPTDILVGPDGNIYFTEQAGNNIGFAYSDGSSITESPLPTPGAGPNGIAVGPDGHLWFCEQFTRKLARYDYGTITEVPTQIGTALGGMVLGPGGDLWFREIGYGGDAIGRLSLSYNPVSPHDSGSNDPITIAPDGTVWFTERLANNVAHVSLFGSVVELPVPTQSAQPAGIALDTDGNAWFTELGANQIGRVNADESISEFTIPAGAFPYDICLGGDGNMWFTELAIGNRVGRVTPNGEIAEFPLPSGTASGIALGQDGNVWVTEHDADIIARVQHDGSVTEYTLPTPSAGPWGISLGPDGKLWFTETNASKVGTIDVNGSVTEFPLPSPVYPFGITAGPDGNVWFMESSLLPTPGGLGRIGMDGSVTEFPVAAGGLGYLVGNSDGSIWFDHGASAGAPVGRLMLPGIGINPTSGPAAGGTSMLIAGDRLILGTNVSIGGVSGPGGVVGDTRMLATTPPLTPGSLNDVIVQRPYGYVTTSANAWFADFIDVAQEDSFHYFVERMRRDGITAGCGGGRFCRNDTVTRAQMAVFLMKVEHGSEYEPPACTGVFPDVPCASPYAGWVEQLAAEGITGGCGGGEYCPDAAVTRAQMAAFILKTEHGAGYVPPACTGLFADVPCPSLFADWVERMRAEGITSGCQASPPDYCPESAVSRGQMAVFLTKLGALRRDRYQLRLYNIDDVMYSYLSNFRGASMFLLGRYYNQDSGLIDITNQLTPGDNQIYLRLFNSSGGYTYGYQLLKNGEVIDQAICGLVGSDGCNNNDQTTGLVYEHTIHFQFP